MHASVGKSANQKRGRWSQYRGKVSKKQKIWEYIRRHPYITVGDMVALFDLKRTTAKWILGWLRKSGAITKVESGRRMEQDVYRVRSGLPVRSPSTTHQSQRRTA